IKLAPWIWDNIKVLVYWYLASTAIVALLLARLWRGRVVFKGLTIVLTGTLVLAGALDILRVLSGASSFSELSREEVRFAEMIRLDTPPSAVILHAPIHNDPVCLTGRQSFLGYPGHIWTHGIDPGPRLDDARNIYAGGVEARALIARYHIGYAVVGPREQALMPLNRPFFERYPLVCQTEEYRLYQLDPGVEP
ncbi:MAG TPA: hypothetical protein VJX67_09170, partial [Blastocatellia bacterium]|nr:hypothetical protein [Blastocatellia bacterium]